RQRRQLELIKDYDCTINCHPRKANIVVDAPTQKHVGTLVTMLTIQKPLLEDLTRLDVKVIKPGGGSYLFHMTVQPTLLERLKVSQ
ncbi:hypothetical protein, partial [Bacillus haynesii]|uniref:hypothetical protein n=1 Tax=Bacillus haynesii TaxID=1925021 RepID=UPI001F619747